MYSGSVHTAVGAVLLSLIGLSACAASELPVVDLGYELQRATLFNETGQFYNFSNIRYAAPPLGNLRFRAPQPPYVNRTTVQNGLPGRICPQATPAWQTVASQFAAEYLEGKRHFSPSDFNATTKPPPIDPRTTEDCLFLDVVVPKNIFDNAGKGKGAAVMVWIYGGGYVGGWKSQDGNPAGLIARSRAHGNTGIIYVSINYRLGAFGWLSGSTFEADGTPNAGLYDQRFALEWVQKHIAKFGGDPSRVTVFGESAGGGSIMHQITAYGGSKGPAPFQQAILQSPAFLPAISSKREEETFDDFLSLLGVQTIAEARQLPSSALQEANTAQIFNAPYGLFVYGPTVDGSFVPALPGLLLLASRFSNDQDLKIMLGHNADEGLLFTSPYIQKDTDFRQDLVKNLPTLKEQPAVLDYMTQVLYPPEYNGSQPYTSQLARSTLEKSEEIVTCNTFYLDKAFANQTFSYLFAVPPALHGYDIPYTYYNGPSPAVSSPNIAIALQEYITHFAQTGSPNQPGVPFFPMYGEQAVVQDLNVTGISHMRDPAANWRCDWWQRALYI